MDERNVSAVLIVCALACCITEKRLVIEIVSASSVPSNLRQTAVGVSEFYINGKEKVTEAEQKDIALMCSKDTQDAVRNKLKEISSSGVRFEGKAVSFDSRGKLSVYYYFDFLYCDDHNSQNDNKNSKIIGPKVAKVTFERKSIILSAIFG